MPDELLALQKIKEGDIKAFETLFKKYYSPLYHYAISVTGRSDIAEEIIQDLFYVMWRDRQTIRISVSLKAYLYGAVRNRSLHHKEHCEVQSRYRNRVLTLQTEPLSLTPLDEMEYQEFEELINNALCKMPERRSTIFKMHRFHGIKYAEIAKTFSVSIKTIEAEMGKAYKTLRQVIDNYKH